MARYVDAIDLPVSIEQAFDYLADFSRTAEWDPSVVEARQLTAPPVGRGTRFLVTVSFLGQSLALEYQIETYERPHRLVLHSRSDTLDSFDVITFRETPNGARLTYVASLELLGVRRLADPILNRLFQQIGSVAVRGLRERLAALRDAGSLPPASAPSCATPSTGEPPQHGPASRTSSPLSPPSTAPSGAKPSTQRVSDSENSACVNPRP